MRKTHMKPDEMEIIRAVSVDLGDGLLMLLTQQYHTELDAGGLKNDRSKSRWRYLGRVARRDDLEAEWLAARRPENASRPWTWPEDPSWKGRILYMNDSTGAGESNWLRLKLSKAVGWDEWRRIAFGWKRDPAKAAEARKKKAKVPAEELYTEFNQAAAWPVEGFALPDGAPVDVMDPESLKKAAGRTFFLESEAGGK